MDLYNPLYLITMYSIFALGIYFFSHSHLPVKQTICQTKRILFIAGITILVTYIKAVIEINLPPTILRVILLVLSTNVYWALYLSLFEGTKAQKLFVILRFQAINNFIEISLWLLLILAVGGEQAMLMQNRGWWSGEIVIITFLFISYWLDKRKKPDAHKHSSMMMLIQELIIVVYLVVSLVLTITTDIALQGYFISLIILLWVYFFRNERKERENYDFQLNQQKYLLLEEHYEEMENYHEKVRIVKHDMKNHLLNLNSHLQQDDYPQVKKQLTHLLQTYQHEISMNDEEGNK